MKKYPIYYINYTRFPTEKAHGVYMAKHLDSFACLGHTVRAVVPRRIGTVDADPQEYYQTVCTIPSTRLPSLDFLWLPFLKKIWHRIGVLSFSLSVCIYAACSIKKDSRIFTSDALVAYLLSFTHDYVVLEVHDYPESSHAWYGRVYKRVFRIITNNSWKVVQLQKDFAIEQTQIFSEHNGVTPEHFQVTHLDKAEVRRSLDIDVSKSVVVYTGHLYTWKGAHTLAAAAELLPEVTVLCVGGTESDVNMMRSRYASTTNVQFIGHRPHHEMPLYQYAADVLVLPNTAKEAISNFYTSPMKLFEYMASKKPIVASKIPSIQEVVEEDSVYFAQPDDATSLAKVITQALSERDSKKQLYKIESAYNVVLEHTWGKRAKRIIAGIS